MIPWPARWGGSQLIFINLGRLAAIVGDTLMATTIILATRLPVIEKQLRGLNQVFVHHHQLGAISFIFLLAAPSYSPLVMFLFPLGTPRSLSYPV